MKYLSSLVLAAATLGLTVGAAAPAEAEYYYTFRLGDASYNFGDFTRFFPEDGITAWTPTLLTIDGETAPVLPPGNLNGFHVESVTLRELNPGFNQTDFNVFDPPHNVNVGEVVGFFMYLRGQAASEGAYSAFWAGRYVYLGDGFFGIAYSTGELTISRNLVPEPASLGMLGLGLLGLLGLAAGRKRSESRVTKRS